MDHGPRGIEAGGQVVGDVMDDHLARMQADARGEVDAVQRALFGTDAAQRVAHVQRRAAGAQRVLFHGDGGAEHRHDAVADHAIDRAAIPPHRINHGIHGGANRSRARSGSSL